MASLGKKVKGQGAQADDPEVVLARKRHEWRKAQLRLKQQKKKEAKMREDAARLEEEKKQIEEEAKLAQEEAKDKSKALRKMKSKYQSRIDSLKREKQELMDEYLMQRETLMNTVREQSKEVKLLEQIVGTFLTPHEMGKVWERSIWDDEAEEWRLPPIKPRSGYSQVGLTRPSYGVTQLLTTLLIVLPVCCVSVG